MKRSQTRRNLLAAAAACVTGLGGAALFNSIFCSDGRAPDDDPLPVPPALPITAGPLHHWFGYYDKLEFDPTDRYVLGMEVSFANRRPTALDVIEIGMVDLEDDNRWLRLGQSSSWSWQQGCQLQWVPASAHQVIWNDRDGDRFVSGIRDVRDAATLPRTLPMPIYCLTPDGRTAFCVDFSRIYSLRPAYGYAGPRDADEVERAPSSSGLWRMDLATGETSLIFSVARAMAFEEPAGGWDPAAKHWIYHVLVSPKGSRLSFLHCSQVPGGAAFSRMITINLDGSEPYVLDPSGKASHYVWRDESHILLWTRRAGIYGFYLMPDRTTDAVRIGGSKMRENGHCTYLRDSRWILCDTYPDHERNQKPFLFDTTTGARQSLGKFSAPNEYREDLRCDTHPRSSRDGRKVVIDSAHTGDRQMYLINIGPIIDDAPPA